ncbi:hypothetical protein ACIBJC_25110 [Streptomyces sp. NPDC050509]|uniref:hypothetical protein n=1 Tax=Streptomyces sp. NPDC050509 TaxID=3365620 RepID=UPI0037B4A605
MNLRMIGLSAAVVCAALVPLVASAGSLGPSLDSLGSLSSLGPEAGPGPAAPEPAAAPVTEDERSRTGATDATARTDTGSGTDTGSRTDTGPGADNESRTDTPVRTVELCGPEVVSPEGVEAQTCVLADGPAAGGDTWGRTYYRNATGGELLAVLSLMGPGGRTVQTHCAIAADDEPATCETPREPSRGKRSGYLAMAEFAAPGKSGSGAHEGPLLLRSGSNSPGPAAD